MRVSLPHIWHNFSTCLCMLGISSGLLCFASLSRLLLLLLLLLALFFCCCLWASAITPALHLAALLHLLPLPRYLTPSACLSYLCLSALATLSHSLAPSACQPACLGYSLALSHLSSSACQPACLPWLYSCTKSPLFLCLCPLPALSLFCCYWVTSLSVVAAAVPYCCYCCCVGCCFWLLFSSSSLVSLSTSTPPPPSSQLALTVIHVRWRRVC